MIRSNERNNETNDIQRNDIETYGAEIDYVVHPRVP